MRNKRTADLGLVLFLGLVASSFLLSCGPKATADDGEPYEYVTSWYIPDTNGDSTASIAATDDYLFVSVDNTVFSDSIYWYTSTGTLGSELIAAITTSSKRPEQVVGVAFNNGALLAVDHSGKAIWSMDPANPEASSQKRIDYGSYFPLYAAANSAGVYAAKRDGSLNWTVDRRAFGASSPAYSYPLPASSDPQGIALDSSGNVFVSDYAGRKVYKLSSSLGLIDTWDLSQSFPYGVAADGDNRVFVLDIGGRRVLVFSSDGSSLGSFGSSGTGDGQFSSAVSIAASPSGQVYVADFQSYGGGRTRILKFQRK